MLPFSNADIHAKVKQDLKADADSIDFLPFGNLEQSVRDDVAFLKASPFIPDTIAISGYIYDVHSGKIIPIS